MFAQGMLFRSSLLRRRLLSPGPSRRETNLNDSALTSMEIDRIIHRDVPSRFMTGSSFMEVFRSGGLGINGRCMTQSAPF